MKKKVLIILGVLVVLVLLVPVINLLVKPDNHDALARLRPDDRSFERVAGILETKCAGCHMPEADLPFYAGLPVAEPLMEEDIDAGLRFLDLPARLADSDGPPPEVLLAKVEHVAANGAMPPLRYRALHWDAALDEDDQQVIKNWITEIRGNHYLTDGVAPEFVHSALQPLPAVDESNPAMVALGERLFHEPLLSGDGTITCASCHGLDTGGTDRLQFSVGIGGQEGGINSPTVFNAGLHVRQFWDGRAADLAEQAGGPVDNPIEMGADWQKVVERLKNDRSYRLDFQKLFPDGVTRENTQAAIAAFEETLVTSDSSFDEYLKGYPNALEKDQVAGYELFTEYGCATCHVGSALGGQSFETMGLRDDYFAGKKALTEADNGRMNFTGDPADRFKFKVPSLRNIAVTWPYFHDGSTESLDEAVRIMAQVQSGVDLTDEETTKIVAFLDSLTGRYKGEVLQ
ncbi:MAG: heme-binding domain-containing protein [Acidobacteria bacterium]|uniref:Heme-binding domain-containing protein n=1 Tax=Candidatus Polarisedimenticola svalbardensis TaxID=2886004 RepID=A0A8J6Y2I9_9BACT|nr:heme-binding domain-containing protein [Candidatus Polarisedimenticola svalbardensis]